MKSSYKPKRKRKNLKFQIGTTYWIAKAMGVVK